MISELLHLHKLDKEFYCRKTITVAKELIGKLLIRIKDRRKYSGIIVETEAYLGRKDPASHSFRGITKRNEVMYKGGGYAYVYFTYGNHFCFNVVAGKEGKGEAVLIRALVPVFGIEQMRRNRGQNDILNLTSGPGKLTKALEIDKSLNGASLTDTEIFITGNEESKYKLATSPRIGIIDNKDALLRFYAKDNPYVSRINYKF